LFAWLANTRALADGAAWCRAASRPAPPKSTGGAAASPAACIESEEGEMDKEILSIIRRTSASHQRYRRHQGRRKAAITTGEVGDRSDRAIRHRNGAARRSPRVSHRAERQMRARFGDSDGRVTRGTRKSTAANGFVVDEPSHHDEEHQKGRDLLFDRQAPARRCRGR